MGFNSPSLHQNFFKKFLKKYLTSLLKYDIINTEQKKGYDIMQVKSIITISKEEQASLNTIYDLIEDIDRDDVAKATIYNQVLKNFNLTLGDIKSLLYDMYQIFSVED